MKRGGLIIILLILNLWLVFAFDAKIEVGSIGSSEKINLQVFGSQFPATGTFVEEASGMWDFWNLKPVEVAKEKISSAKISPLRFPSGSEATGFDWKVSIGPIANRPKYNLDPVNAMNYSFGVGEFFTLSESTNSEKIYVVGIRESDLDSSKCSAKVYPTKKEDFGDFASFVNCPYSSTVDSFISSRYPSINWQNFIVNKSEHDWRYWVAIRKNFYNHPESYNLKYVELDNEISDPITSTTYCSSSGKFVNLPYSGLSQTQYASKFVEYSSTMNSILNSCGGQKISLGVDTHFRFQSDEALNQLFVKLKQNYDSTGEKPDFLVFHKYVMFNDKIFPQDREGFVKRKLSSSLSFQRDIDKIQKIFYDNFNEKIPLTLTEFSVSDAYPSHGWTETELNEQLEIQNSLGVAIASADLYTTLLDPDNKILFATQFYLLSYTRWAWDDAANYIKYNPKFGALLGLRNGFNPYTIKPFVNSSTFYQFYQERPNYGAIKFMSEDLLENFVETKIFAPTFDNNLFASFAGINDFTSFSFPPGTQRIRLRLDSSGNNGKIFLKEISFQEKDSLNKIFSEDDKNIDLTEDYSLESEINSNQKYNLKITYKTEDFSVGQSFESSFVINKTSRSGDFGQEGFWFSGCNKNQIVSTNCLDGRCALIGRRTASECSTWDKEFLHQDLNGDLNNQWAVFYNFCREYQNNFPSTILTLKGKVKSSLSLAGGLVLVVNEVESPSEKNSLTNQWEEKEVSVTVSSNSWNDICKNGKVVRIFIKNSRSTEGDVYFEDVSLENKISTGESNPKFILETYDGTTWHSFKQFVVNENDDYETSGIYGVSKINALASSDGRILNLKIINNDLFDGASVSVNLPQSFSIINCSEFSGANYLSNNEEIFSDPKNPSYKVSAKILSACGAIEQNTYSVFVSQSSILSVNFASPTIFSIEGSTSGGGGGGGGGGMSSTSELLNLPPINILKNETSNSSLRISCLNFGDSFETTYCNRNNLLVDKKIGGEFCLGDFECLSDSCYGIICTSHGNSGIFKGFLKNFLNIFRF